MTFPLLDTGDYHMMDWWFQLFGPYWWIFMVIGMGIYVGINILIAYYIHKDAIQRGIKNSEIWLIIGLIFSIVGLLIYLLVRSNYRYVDKNPK